jgi:hypothetical protein
VIIAGKTAPVMLFSNLLIKPHNRLATAVEIDDKTLHPVSENVFNRFSYFDKFSNLLVRSRKS